MGTKPFAIMSDQHYHNWSAFSHYDTLHGVNSRLIHILGETRRCAKVLEEQGGNVIYCAGDMFHVRGKVEPSVINPVFDLFGELIAEGFEIRAIPGNHDLATNESSSLGNAMQSLQHAGVDVQTAICGYADHELAVFPWEPNLEKLEAGLRNLAGKFRYAIIHAPLNGVIKGIPDLGLDPELLAEYDYKKIFCGHYHNYKTFTGTCGSTKVVSLGALTHQTWNDVDSIAGFTLVYPTGHVHYESSAPKFVDFNTDWTDKEAKEICEGNYVRVKLDYAISEADIAVIRKHIISSLNAQGCVIKAIPMPTTTTRTASIKSGASLARSITEWVALHADNMNVDKNKLSFEALDVLSHVESSS